MTYQQGTPYRPQPCVWTRGGPQPMLAHAAFIVVVIKWQESRSGYLRQFASLIIHLETIWRAPTPCQAQQYASLRGKSGTCPGLNSGLSITDPCRIPGLQPCLLAGRWAARGPGRRLVWLLFRVSHSEQFFPRATILHDGTRKRSRALRPVGSGGGFQPPPHRQRGALCRF